MNVEMQLAESRLNKGEAKIIPIIARPCEWQEIPLFRKILGGTTNNKPLSKWADLDDALLDVTRNIRKVIDEISRHTSTIQPLENHLDEVRPQVSSLNQPMAALPRSSNLTTRKVFTDQDRDLFLEEAYSFVRKFFEGSLEELVKRNRQLSFRIKNIDHSAFQVSLYDTGKSANACTIFIGDIFGRGIAYSAGETTQRNSTHENLRVESNDHSLYLISNGFAGLLANKNKRLTFEGSAEHLWALLISPLQGSGQR